MNWISSFKNSLGHNKKTALQIVLILGGLFSLPVVAQQTKNLDGRVFGKNGDVAGIHVMNITTKKGTITDANGFFSITVHLNDTLVFSAIQFTRKELVVDLKILKSRLLNIYLEEGEIKLDEVLVMPYNLTGDLSKDLDSLKIGNLISASSLKLPNADVKPLTQSQRKFYTARTWDAYFYVIAAGTKIDPLINYFSGRTKMLNQRVAREAQSKRVEEVRGYYSDTLYIQDLKVPKNKIVDFIYYCEKDSLFEVALNNGDHLKLWEFMRKKSITYRESNNL